MQPGGSEEVIEIEVAMLFSKTLCQSRLIPGDIGAQQFRRLDTLKGRQRLALLFAVITMACVIKLEKQKEKE